MSRESQPRFVGLVAVGDTGADFNHPDLRQNIKVNPLDIPGGWQRQQPHVSGESAPGDDGWSASWAEFHDIAAERRPEKPRVYPAPTGPLGLLLAAVTSG